MHGDSGDEGQIVAYIGVAGIVGFNGSNFTISEQPEKIAQPPAGERHVLGGEKQLDAILGRIGFVVRVGNLFEGVVHQLRVGEAVDAIISGDASRHSQGT